MRNNRSIIFGFMLGACVLGVTLFANLDRTTHDSIFLFSSLVMSASLGFVPSAASLVGRGRSAEAAIARQGLVGIGGLAVGLLGILTFIMAYSGSETASVIGAVGTALMLVAVLMLASFSTQAQDAMALRRDYRSSHARWACELDNLAGKTHDLEMRSALTKRAQAWRFAARDTDDQQPLEADVGRCLDQLNLYLADDDTLGMTARLDEMDEMLSVRGRVLAQHTSKV